jgi:hypothetical protein
MNVLVEIEDLLDGPCSIIWVSIEERVRAKWSYLQTWRSRSDMEGDAIANGLIRETMRDATES